MKNFGLPKGFIRKFKWNSFFGKSSEILFLQIIVKAISLLAFASAARILGPTNLAESTLLIGTLGVFCAFSALYNDAFLARQITKYTSTRARGRFVGRVLSAQIATATALCILFVLSLFLSKADVKAWVGLIGGVFLLFSAICHPRWLFVSQGRMTTFWRISAIGSCITATLLFSITEPFAAPAVDITCIGLGTSIATLIGWKIACAKEELTYFPLSKHHILKYFCLLLNKSKWLSLAYLLASVSATADSLIIGVMADPVTAGIFRPMAYLAGSTQQALSFIPLLLFPIFLRRNKETTGLPLLQFSIILALGFSFLCILIVSYFCVGPIFTWLYGSQLDQGAQPFLWLLAAKLISVLNYIFLWGLIARHRDKTVVLLYAFALATNVTLNLLLIPQIGLFGPGVAAVIAESLVIVVAGLLLFSQIRRFKRGTLTQA